MRWQRRRIIACTTLLLLVVLLVAGATVDVLGFSGGGPTPAQEARTTGCTCHGPTPSTVVTYRLEGVPLSYIPGDRYEISLTISGGPPALEGQHQGGFAMVVSNGTFSPHPDFAVQTQVFDLDVSTYNPADSSKQNAVTHTSDGNRQRSWKVLWDAPRGKGNAVFYIAGNSVNGNNVPDLDGSDQWVMLRTVSIGPKIAAGEQPPGLGPEPLPQWAWDLGLLAIGAFFLLLLIGMPLLKTHDYLEPRMVEQGDYDFEDIVLASRGVLLEQNLAIWLVAMVYFFYAIFVKEQAVVVFASGSVALVSFANVLLDGINNYGQPRPAMVEEVRRLLLSGTRARLVCGYAAALLFGLGLAAQDGWISLAWPQLNLGLGIVLTFYAFHTGWQGPFLPTAASTNTRLVCGGAAALATGLFGLIGSRVLAVLRVGLETLPLSAVPGASPSVEELVRLSVLFVVALLLLVYVAARSRHTAGAQLRSAADPERSGSAKVLRGGKGGVAFD